MSNEFPPEQFNERTAQFATCVFPDGLQEEEYFPLLFLLTQEMSLRTASAFVGGLLGMSYVEIYNDASGARNSKPNPKIIERLKHRLEECGYHQWLDEPTS